MQLRFSVLAQCPRCGRWGTPEYLAWGIEVYNSAGDYVWSWIPPWRKCTSDHTRLIRLPANVLQKFFK